MAEDLAALDWEQVFRKGYRVMMRQKQLERMALGRQKASMAKGIATPKKTEERMLELGWALADTGGGCTAYRKEDPQGNGHWLVTEYGGACVPTHPQEYVLVGCYDNEGNPVGYVETTFRHILSEAVKFAPINPKKDKK